MYIALPTLPYFTLHFNTLYYITLRTYRSPVGKGVAFVADQSFIIRSSNRHSSTQSINFESPPNLLCIMRQKDKHSTRENTTLTAL